MTIERENLDANENASALSASEDASTRMFTEAIRDQFQGASGGSSTADSAAPTLRMGTDALANIPSQLDFGTDSLYGQAMRTPRLNENAAGNLLINPELAAKQEAAAKAERVREATQDPVASELAAKREAAVTAQEAAAKAQRVREAKEDPKMSKLVKNTAQNDDAYSGLEQKPLKKPGQSAEAAGKKPAVNSEDEGLPDRLLRKPFPTKELLDDPKSALPLDSQEKLKFQDKERSSKFEKDPIKKQMESDKELNSYKKEMQSDKELSYTKKQMAADKNLNPAEKQIAGDKDLDSDKALRYQKEQKLKALSESAKPGYGGKDGVETKPLKFPAGGKESKEQESKKPVATPEGDAPKKPVATPSQGEMNYGRPGEKGVQGETTDASDVNATVDAESNIGKSESLTLRETTDGNFSHTSGDGTRITVRPDGVTLVESQGTQSKVAPDGSLVVTTNGIERHYNPQTANRESVVGGAPAYHYADLTVVRKNDGGMVLSRIGGSTVETFGHTPKLVNYTSRVGE